MFYFFLKQPYFSIVFYKFPCYKLSKKRDTHHFTEAFKPLLRTFKKKLQASNVSNLVKQKGEEMREVLIALDEQIFKNRNFGEVKLVPKETVTRRRILTADFIIENLPMRWYRVWVEEEQKFIPFCPLRIVLGLNKFQRNSQNLIERIWSFLGKGKRRGDITDIFNSIGINFGERLVTSLLRKIDLDNQEVKPVKIKQLFITADEATTPCRVENRKVEPITTRIACFYELHKNNKITFKDAYFRDYRKGEKRNLDE
jgi:hypothetical protein